MIVAKSLLRQGFRRQVWLSSGQGPAPLTVGTLVREFFEETHVPILSIDLDAYLPKLKLAADVRSKTPYVAHYITGRIEDLPLKGDYGAKESEQPVRFRRIRDWRAGTAGVLGEFKPRILHSGCAGARRRAGTGAARDSGGAGKRDVLVPKFGKMMP